MSISYERAGQSTDAETLAEYLIEGIENNNDINSASTTDWDDAYHAIDVYLDHNESVNLENSDLFENIGTIVQKWMDNQEAS